MINALGILHLLMRGIGVPGAAQVNMLDGRAKSIGVTVRKYVLKVMISIR